VGTLLISAVMVIGCSTGLFAATEGTVNVLPASYHKKPRLQQRQDHWRRMVVVSQADYCHYWLPDFYSIKTLMQWKKRNKPNNPCSHETMIYIRQ
jgi:hypothetical protein